MQRKKSDQRYQKQESMHEVDFHLQMEQEKDIFDAEMNDDENEVLMSKQPSTQSLDHYNNKSKKVNISQCSKLAAAQDETNEE